MSRSDGSVIIDTKLNTEGFSKGASNLKSQFSSLTSSVGKLGAAIGVAFSVKTIVDFSKKALELGSDLQEVQNVVDVTFTTMNKQIDEFAKNAARTAGLSETMAKKYAGTFGAMSKSFGFTEQEAYSMSTALTQLTGDVASFYNLTQDEAYTKLKSVFTGETESLKDLGVVMTQTALDDYALRKGLGKTTQQMSEQEKVALRYSFVLDQLAGASGYFVRTQDGWANQTRILKLQTESLMATFGQGLINVLTPALKMLNTMIGKLQEFADAFKQVTEALFGNASSDSTGGVAGSLGSAADNAGELEDNISDAGKAAKKALAGFDEINVLTQKAEENTEGANYSLNMIPTDFGPLTMPISVEVEDKTSTGTVPIVASLLKIKDKLHEAFEPVSKFNLDNLSGSVDRFKGSFDRLGSVLSEKMEWAWTNVLVPFGKWSIEKGLPKLIDTLSSAFDTMGSIIDYYWPTFDDLWNEFLAPIAGWKVDEVIWGLDLLTGGLKALGNHFDLSVPKAYELSDAEKEIATNATLAYNAFVTQKEKSEKVEEAIEDQYSSVKLLADELFVLAGKSGEVKDADKARAEYILGQLNTALGTEYSMVGNVIQQYGDLKEEIYSLIAAKKANALLDANSETYQKALLTQNDAYAVMKINEKAYKAQKEQADRHIESFQKEIEKLKKEREYYSEMSQKYGQSDPFGTYANKATDIGEKIRILERKIANQQALVADILLEYEKAASAYSGIFDAISEYDNASTLIAEGNFEEAIRILSGYAYANDDATDKIESAAERLKKNALDAGYYAQRLLGEYETGATDVTREAVQAATNAFNEAIEELEKVDTSAAKELGLDFGMLFAAGIKDASGAIQNALNAVLSGASLSPVSGISFGSVGNFSVPHLASGAVIPPNAPFMAVLGDQGHGRNLEAPEGLIRQIMREELENMGINVEVENKISFEGELAQLARLLKPAIDTETRRRGGSLAKGTVI